MKKIFFLLLLIFSAGTTLSTPKGGGAGQPSGGGSSGGGGGGFSPSPSGGDPTGGGSFYPGGGGFYPDSSGSYSGEGKPMSHHDKVVFGATMGSVVGFVAFICLCLSCCRKCKKKSTDRLQTHETMAVAPGLQNSYYGGVARKVGLYDDTSHEDYQRGLEFCRLSQPWPKKDLFKNENVTYTYEIENETKTILSNYPLNDNYFEATLIHLPKKTVVGIGIANGPYPEFRLPGHHRQSVAVHSDDGHKFYENSFGGISFTKKFVQGDIIGVGIQNKNDIYYTKNGIFLGVAFNKVSMTNYFATVGVCGVAKIHLNFNAPFKYSAHS